MKNNSNSPKAEAAEPYPTKISESSCRHNCIKLPLVKWCMEDPLKNSPTDSISLQFIFN